MDLGSVFILEVVYHDAPNSGIPDKQRPGVVRGPDGKLYVLELITEEE